MAGISVVSERRPSHEKVAQSPLKEMNVGYDHKSDQILNGTYTGHKTLKAHDSSSASEDGTDGASEIHQMAGNNPTLNREVGGCANILMYCSILISFDVCKQLTSYGMKYYNNDTYPIPQTQIVASTELLKFCVFLGLTVASGEVSKMKISYYYAIPSLIYMMNNNIFYFAMHYTTPPIWNILIQLRIILTGLTYRMFFKRAISSAQWVGLVLLILAIVVGNWRGNTTDDVTGRQLIQAFVLALFGSVTSVIGTVTMEFLFKNDSRSFFDMQLQLYMFGSLGAWILYTIDIVVNNNQHSVINGDSTPVYSLIVCDVLLSSLVGCVVAVIVKKFDNIVKLYTQAMSNMFTAIACSILFPDRFHLNALFLCCLLVVFIAICLYESKGIFKTDGSLTATFVAASNTFKAHRVAAALVVTSVVALMTTSYFYK